MADRTLAAAFGFSRPLPRTFGATTDSATIPALRGRMGIFGGSWVAVLTHLLARSYTGFNRVSAGMAGVYTLFADYLLEGKTALMAGHNRTAFKPVRFCQLSYEKRHPVHGYLAGASLISLLLFSGGPMAVVGGVIAVIIFSVYGKPGRSRSHIVDKGVRAIEPPLADSYASTAVVAILGVIGVVAPLLYAGKHTSQRVVGISNHRHVHSSIGRVGYSYMARDTIGESFVQR